MPGRRPWKAVVPAELACRRISGRVLRRRVVFVLLSAVCLWIWGAGVAWAQEGAAPAADSELNLRELFRAGGVIGIIILALSVAMLALIVEHLLSIRRSALLPPGLAEDVHEQIAAGQFKQAEQHCREQPSLLGRVLAAGLAEAGLGYAAIEKSMEDAATEQSARLHRKIEYLSVIGTIAPMLGLLGTVWGMIQAFLEFESKANPQVSELAPGIYKALVTTLLGLGVAVPALASFAIFRNRIDELVAESALTAEQVFADYKRALAARRQKSRPKPGDAGTAAG
jgi:biopolymer transport protein ExbB